MTDFNIHDLHLHPIECKEAGKVVLRFDDHLLRRFGQVEVRELAESAQTDFTQRSAADELWAVIGGAVSFLLIDQRSNSPTFEKTDTYLISVEDNQALLIPFGVAYALESDQASRLLRLATHADDTHKEDQHLPRGAFAELTT